MSLMHTFRLDHNSNGGDIRLFVQEDITVKLAASGTSIRRSLCGGKAKKSKLVDRLFL